MVVQLVRNAAAGPSGRVIRSRTTCSAMSSASDSGSFLKPSAVIVAMTGKMRLGRSGPPVAE